MSKKAKEEVIEEVTVPTISEESSELGTIRINHSVIAGIVRLAAQSVQGVVNVGSAGVVEGLTDFFSKKESERGVKLLNLVMVDTKLKLELYLNLESICKNGCCHSGKYKGTNPFDDRKSSSIN